MAQGGDTIPLLPADTGYIEKMDELLAFKLSANSDVRSFTLPIAGKQATIAPNMELINKLSVNYRFLSFSVSYAPKFIPGNADDDRKGVTRNGGFDLDLSFSKWIMGGHYTWTYGYYLANTKDFDPSWDEGSSPYVQFTDLFYREWGGFLSYKANPRFSLRALTTQTERQRKSAGSFFPALSGRYYIMDDRTELNGTNSSQRSDNVELMLSPGYYHTFVMKRDFYVGLGTYSGIGMLHTDLTTRTPGGEFRSRQDNPIFRV